MENSNEAIKEQVFTILADRCQITMDTGAGEQKIHLDSMALMELIVGLENTFNIKFDNSRLGDFYGSPSVDKITQLVVEQVTTKEV